MNDRHSVVKKALAILMSQAEKGLQDMAKLLVDLAKWQGNMIGQAQAMQEAVADFIVKDNELLEKLKGMKMKAYNPSTGNEEDRLILDVINERSGGGKYNPATIFAAVDGVKQAFESIYTKAKSNEQKFGELSVKFEDVQVGKDELARLKKKYDKVNKAADALRDRIKQLSEKTKGVKIKQLVTNFDELSAKAKDSGAAFREALLKEEEKRNKEKDKGDKPSDKPGEKTKAVPPHKTDPGLAPAFKKEKDKPAAEPGKAKTSLDSDLSVVAEGADSEMKAFAADLDALMDLSEEMAASVMEEIEEMSAIADESASLASESEAILGEAMQSSEEPADQPESADEPGMMDQIMDMFTPEQGPEMQAVPASMDDAWVREADVKRFPSEYDRSGGSWELVDVVEADGSGDGKRQEFVINKDLKARVEKKVRDIQSGAFKPNQSVLVDNGDMLVEATIVSYAGDGMYDVSVNGEIMRGPAECICVPNEDLWR